MPQRSSLEANPLFSIRGAPPTASMLLSPEMLASKYGKEAEEVVDAMGEAMHVAAMATLLLEEKKDKTAIGLHGMELEREFGRRCRGGSTTLVEQAVLVALARRLQAKFPDDPILTDEDTDVLPEDEDFAALVAFFLGEYGIVDGCMPGDVVAWSRHAGTYRYDSEGPSPRRFWAINPVDTKEEFRQNKQYCITLTLIEDGQPVVSAIASPIIPFDHHTRTVEHPLGCPLFFAVQGQGSFTQLMLMQRDCGVYLGKCRFRGRPLPLKASEKIKRGNDGLYDVLSSEQLRIAMGTNLREDIFVDAERIGKILGSEYPKFHMLNSSLKYCWLARGDDDIIWYLKEGLYDKSATERLVNHAAGVLIALESGAAVTDLDGKPIEWCGPFLEKNRGVIGTDPSTVPLPGLVAAIKEATATSEDLYEQRCEQRREVSKILENIFKNLGNFAETDEEKEGARKVLAKGMAMLKDEQQMNEIAQDAVNRSKPIFGEGPQPDNTWSGDQALPMSPIANP